MLVKTGFGLKLIRLTLRIQKSGFDTFWSVFNTFRMCFWKIRNWSTMKMLQIISNSYNHWSKFHPWYLNGYICQISFPSNETIFSFYTLVALSNPSTLTSLFNKDPLEILLGHSVNIIFTAYKTNLTNETFYILRMELWSMITGIRNELATIWS